MDTQNILKSFLLNPGRFSVLILGERGTGKTRWVKQIAQDDLKKKIVTANCAAFSDDTMAESELFGHVKGAFTDAITDKKGLFQEANGGILFLDEVHNLSSRVQGKLMTALQTESSGKNKGKFCIRRLGDNQANFVAVQPVFATNLQLNEFKNKILPDFFDRISQLITRIPTIQEGNLELFKIFRTVWDELQFRQYAQCPDSNMFKTWLRQIPLEGNYRTLQNIAINWHQGRLLYAGKNEEAVFEFVRKQFKTFYYGNSLTTEGMTYNFRKGISKKQLQKEYQIALYDWAISENGYGNKVLAEIGLSHSRLADPRKTK